MEKSTKPFDEQWDVVIIGAGMGGLVCGVSLAKRGKRVKIIEQHYQPAGYFTTFNRKGFTFDSAFHVMGECEKGGWFYDVLEALELQRSVDFCQVNWRILYPGGAIELPPGVDKILQMLTEKFPKEKEGLVKFFETMKSIRKELVQLSGPSPTIEKYRLVTFQHLLDEYLNDNTLKAILSGCWPYTGLPPSKVSAVFMSGLSTIYFFSQGPFYPRGGPKALVDSIVKLFKGNGGELELNSLVEEIIVEEGRAVGVRTRSGKRIRAHQVVSNVDAKQTFNRLISHEFLNPAFVEEVNKKEVSISTLNVYLGVDMDLKDMGFTVHETFANEKGTSDEAYEAALKGDIFRSSITITIPTLFNPQLAPANNHCIVIYALAPYHMEGVDWIREKERFTEELIKRAEEVIPNLSKHIVVKDSATPLTSERFTLNDQGSLEGWASTPEEALRRLPLTTSIKNLYLTGHWTLPGGGINLVTRSGLMLADLLIKDNYSATKTPSHKER